MQQTTTTKTFNTAASRLGRRQVRLPSATVSDRLLQLAQPRARITNRTNEPRASNRRSNPAAISERLRQLATPRNPKPPVQRKQFIRKPLAGATPRHIPIVRQPMPQTGQMNDETEREAPITADVTSSDEPCFAIENVSVQGSVSEFPAVPSTADTASLPTYDPCTSLLQTANVAIVEVEPTMALITAGSSSIVESALDSMKHSATAMDPFYYRRVYLEHIERKRKQRKDSSTNQSQAMVRDNGTENHGKRNRVQELQAFFGN